MVADHGRILSTSLLSRISSCKQSSACRSAEQTTEGVVARHPVSQTKKLVEEVLLGPGEDRHIYCCRAEPRLSPGPAQGGRKRENGRLRRCFAESKGSPEN